MTVEYNIPKTVTDGLVLALDAGNTKSYPGSGSTWTDTIGGNNGTLTNGPTHSSNSGGYFDFPNIRTLYTIIQSSFNYHYPTS